MSWSGVIALGNAQIIVERGTAPIWTDPTFLNFAIRIRLNGREIRIEGCGATRNKRRAFLLANAERDILLAIMAKRDVLGKCSHFSVVAAFYYAEMIDDSSSLVRDDERLWEIFAKHVCTAIETILIRAWYHSKIELETDLNPIQPD